MPDTRLSISLPAPADVLTTLTTVLGRVYPGAVVSTGWRNEVVLTIPEGARPRRARARWMRARTAQDVDVLKVDNGVTLALGELVNAVLARSVRKILDDTPGAENYIEQEVVEAQSGRTYVLTIRRGEGQTPQTMRARAESAAAALRDDVARISALTDADALTELRALAKRDQKQDAT